MHFGDNFDGGKKGGTTNFIDRLLSERDSQFSNFNEKIDRLRHGHSANSSFKDHRRTAVFNETVGYHSSTCKPKLQKVQEINWSKQRFVLSAKNQQPRRDTHALLKQPTPLEKSTFKGATERQNPNNPSTKHNYSFLASNTN